MWQGGLNKTFTDWQMQKKKKENCKYDWDRLLLNVTQTKATTPNTVRVFVTTCSILYIYTLGIIFQRPLQQHFHFRYNQRQSEMESGKERKKTEKTVSEWSLFLFIPLNAEANRPDCCEACLTYDLTSWISLLTIIYCRIQ